MKTVKQRIHPFVFAESLIVILSAHLLFCSCSKKSGDDNPDPGPNTVDAQVSIQFSEDKQVIQGFGCATVFAPPNTTAYSSQEFDRLFGSGNGQVGLSILRIRVATDAAWRAVELNHAQWAVSRGARILASPWSPPENMKTNNSLVGGSLIADSGASYARYLNAFADYMSANGATLYAISVQNEPDWNPSYEGCAWTADQMRDFLKNHGQLVTSTRLMAPELVNNNQGYIGTLLGDNSAAANLDIIGTHIYGGGIIDNPMARTLGKEVWMTEHLDTNVTYSANLNTAVEIHDCLTKANFSAYIWWYGKRYYGPIGQDGAVTKRGFAISQFARFIRPGAIRNGVSANSRADVLISAFRNGTKKVIVAINTGANNVNQQFTLQGASPAQLVPFITTDSKNAEQAAAVSVTGGAFTYLLPPRSIASFVEQ